MSHPLCYTMCMIVDKDINKESLKPLFDLDGTLITEDRESTRLFDFDNPSAILNLTEDDLTPLGKLVRDSGKEFDILTARGIECREFIHIRLSSLGFNVRDITCVGISASEVSDGVITVNMAQQVVINKQKVVRASQRKLVDNDARNLEGLGELGELVTQTQTEF